VAPGLVGAAEPRTTARRCPAQSSPLTCASATFLAPGPSCPREPGQHRTGIAPNRSAAASALSCARAAGWTGPCYAERVASGVDVSWMTAVALAAGALVLFVSVAIPLLRENEPVSPAAQSLSCARFGFGRT
jgi:hypothetical protein